MPDHPCTYHTHTGHARPECLHPDSQRSGFRVYCNVPVNAADACPTVRRGCDHDCDDCAVQCRFSTKTEAGSP